MPEFGTSRHAVTFRASGNPIDPRRGVEVGLQTRAHAWNLLLAACAGAAFGAVTTARVLRQEVRPAHATNVDVDLNATPILADGSVPSPWRVAGFDDPSEFRRWLATFRRFVAADDRDAVVASVQFPIFAVDSAPELRERYDEFFTGAVKRAVATFDEHDIWRNYQGAMIHHGTLWFRQTDHGYRVVAINPDAAE